MKIVLIGPYPENIQCIRGGTESSVYGLAEALKMTHLVFVFDYPRQGSQDAIEHTNGVDVYRWCNPGKHNEDAVKCIKPMLQQLALIQPDIVHVHGTDLFCYKVYVACKKTGYPVISTVHGLLAVEKKKALRRHFSLKALYQFIRQNYTERMLLNNATDVLVDTEYVAEALRGYGLRRLPILHIIPQGINERYYELRCSTNSKVILSVGTISRRKGRIQLIDAFDQLCISVPDAELVIAGTDKEKSTVLMVKERIAQSPNKGRIHLLLNKSQEEIFALYQQAHLFALHTEEESQGIVFSEAMACGLPVVSTRVGGVPYVVKEGTGLLCAFGDTKTMANHMQLLLSDAALWQTYSEHCLVEAKYYQWSQITQRVTTLYQQVIS